MIVAPLHIPLSAIKSLLLMCLHWLLSVNLRISITLFLFNYLKFIQLLTFNMHQMENYFAIYKFDLWFSVLLKNLDPGCDMSCWISLLKNQFNQVITWLGLKFCVYASCTVEFHITNVLITMSKYKFNLFHKSSGFLSSQSRYQKTTKQTFVGLENVFKKSSRHALKTSSTHLQRNNFTSCMTSWRPLRRQKVVTLKTSSRCLQDLSWRCLKETSWKHALKMSWRWVEDISSRRLEDIMETNKILTGDICMKQI